MASSLKEQYLLYAFTIDWLAVLKKVMIFDNDGDVLDVMRETLIYGGFDVEIVNETDNIFLLIDKYDPDVLLIDYMLKGANGGEICRALKANPKTCKLPIIIISAYLRNGIQSFDNYACDAFIAKPFDLYELIDTVCELTGRPPYSQQIK